jgi:iron complex transport system permease protein
MFGSITTLVNRLIDPNEFATLQDRLFARFTSVDSELLGLSAVVVALSSVAAWRLGRRLDVVALGREPATSLGVDHRAVVDRALVVVAVLVAVATALVGPITFLGLLVANLARQALGTARHRATLPAASLIAVIALVGGQLLLERVFAFDTSLSVIINFVGGVYFIALLLREARR